jgi:hypothetical protein
MFRLMLSILFCGLFNISFAQKIQLSPPKSNVQMAMVGKDHPQNLVLDFRMEGATIRYTLDGTEPTINSKLYKIPLKISKPVHHKSQSISPGF